MVVVNNAPMSITLEEGELRRLCEIAVRAPIKTLEEMDLLVTICHHMIWDDLIEVLSA